MRNIDFPGRGFNVEEILSFAENLKQSFHSVRVRFYRAEFREDNFRPSHVARTEPGQANYILIHLNGRESIQFHKKRGGSGAYLFDDNLSEFDAQAVLKTLAQNRARNAPQPPKIAVHQLPPEKPFFSKLLDSIGKLFSSFKPR